MVARDDHDNRSRGDRGEMMPVTIYISMTLMEEVNRLSRAGGTSAGIVIYQLLQEWVREHREDEQTD